MKLPLLFEFNKLFLHNETNTKIELIIYELIKYTLSCNNKNTLLIN